jgi:uncharacterized membrane protein YfcA
MVILLILVGLIAGTFIGMIGTGAGVVMIPGMMYLGGLSLKEAVGVTLLMQTIPVGVTGAYQYWEKGLLPFIPASMIAIGMIVGITAGGYLTTGGFVNESQLRYLFGLIAIITGISILLDQSI